MNGVFQPRIDVRRGRTALDRGGHTSATTILGPTRDSGPRNVEAVRGATSTRKGLSRQPDIDGRAAAACGGQSTGTAVDGRESPVYDTDDKVDHEGVDRARSGKSGHRLLPGSEQPRVLRVARRGFPAGSHATGSDRRRSVAAGRGRPAARAERTDKPVAAATPTNATAPESGGSAPGRAPSVVTSKSAIFVDTTVPAADRTSELQSTTTGVVVATTATEGIAVTATIGPVARTAESVAAVVTTGTATPGATAVAAGSVAACRIAAAEVSQSRGPPTGGRWFS